MRSSHILPVTLNESPSEKEGKLEKTLTARFALGALNESPSEKEGKSGAAQKSSGTSAPPQ